MNQQLCECQEEPLWFDRYIHIKHLGTDETHGRFGEVDLLQCKSCGRYWLQYLVEYESFTGSGRYFMGLITKEIADTLSPDKAVEFLNSLDWHLCGGSFFGRKGKATGTINVDF